MVLSRAERASCPKYQPREKDLYRLYKWWHPCDVAFSMPWSTAWIQITAGPQVWAEPETCPGPMEGSGWCRRGQMYFNRSRLASSPLVLLSKELQTPHSWCAAQEGAAGSSPHGCAAVMLWVWSLADGKGHRLLALLYRSSWCAHASCAFKSKFPGRRGTGWVTLSEQRSAFKSIRIFSALLLLLSLPPPLCTLFSS